MIPTEWFQKIRRLEIRSRLVSEQLMAGHATSIFKGRGLDFEEVREYVPGDDVRRIDWNVSGRMRRPFVRRYIEERELAILLLVDLSASGHFGTAGRTKRELAAELAGALAFSAIRDNDRVGLVLFTDIIERYVPLRKGRQHILRLLRDLLYHPVRGAGTSIRTALGFLQRVVHRPAIVFLISDFIDEGYERLLKAVNRRHDVIALHLVDPRELTLPDVGWAQIRDAESGEDVEIDTSDPAVRAAYEQGGQEQLRARREFFIRSAIGYAQVRTDQPYQRRLQTLFEHRARSKAG
jgi:uncharacterized protein (DUF58 family)